MTAATDAPGFKADDYDAIEAAVMETTRGRWFLAEFARRHRAADTAAVLAALAKLETRIAAPTPATIEPDVARIRMDLKEMAAAIARTKAEIAAIKPEGADGRFEEASIELDAIVQATETATGDILSAAETIQEIAWNLREMGAEAEVCDLIDVKATDIYTACSFQDITGQRTRKVISVLRFLEDRIDAMMGIWGAEAASAPQSQATAPPALARGDGLLNGPARPGEGLGQADVDGMLDDDLFSPPSRHEPAAKAVADTVSSVQPADRVETASVAVATLDPPSAVEAAPSHARRREPPAPALAPALGARFPAALPSVEDIERLTFTEKSALMG